MLFNSKKLDPSLIKMVGQAGLQSTKRCKVLVNIKAHASPPNLGNGRYFASINVVALECTNHEILELTKNPLVGYISLDDQCTIVMDIATRVIGANTRWRTSLTGKGYVVAVLDTGIYPHPDLQGRIIGFHDVLSGKIEPYDDHGHGTHVAGVLAGDGRMSRGKYKGVAPMAKVVGVKVLNDKGNGHNSDIIDGIDWVINNRRKYSIKAINLSLGSPARLPHHLDPLCLSVAKAVKLGVAVFVAVGNGGPYSSSVFSPGTEPLAITVGAMDARGTVNRDDHRLADLSSRGPTLEGVVKPDLVAPGVNITSLNVPALATAASPLGNLYTTLSGTSMSTPMAAGMAALLLQRYGDLTPKQLKYVLKRGCTALTGKCDWEGAGVIDLHKSIEWLASHLAASSCD